MWWNSAGFDCRSDGVIAKVGVGKRHEHEVCSDCRIVEDIYRGFADRASDGGGRGAYLNLFRLKLHFFYPFDTHDGYQLLDRFSKKKIV